uniref:Uncharacterized protein n=1 Tax=Lepeophtheirus salmonis TaxID=72036 RepID=A0A0K2TNK7_LEPSM
MLISNKFNPRNLFL